MINAHIVDEVFQRQGIDINAFAASPTATEGKIEQQVEIFVEGPVAVGVGTSPQYRKLQFVVDVPHKPIGVPLEGIDMPGFGIIDVGARCIAVRLVIAVVLGRVYREIDVVRVVAYVLDNIDFATSRQIGRGSCRDRVSG